MEIFSSSKNKQIPEFWGEGGGGVNLVLPKSGFLKHPYFVGLLPSCRNVCLNVWVSDFLKYEAAVSNCLYLTQFLTDFGQILDSKSYDQD